MDLTFVEAPQTGLMAGAAVPEIDHERVILPGITYTRVAAYRHPAAFPNPFLKVNPLTESAFRQFDRVQRVDAGSLGGITSIKAPWVLGRFGALIDPVARTAPTEFPTHVDRLFARADLEFFPTPAPAFPDATNSARPVRFTFDCGSINRIPAGVLLTQAGTYTYGHWLLDMVPRLTVLRRMMMTRRFSDMAIYHFGMPEYARHFLELMGLEGFRFVELKQNVLYEAAELHEPAPIKIGYWVNLDQLAQSLHSFRLAASAYAGRLPVRDDPLLNTPPEKVYFSRERWRFGDQTRNFANRKDMGVLLGRLGFIPVHVEDYSVAELTILLSNAKMIVGEDGSALHNVVLSPNSCSIVAVTPNARMNLWHGSLCAAMGHRIAFVQGLGGEASPHMVPIEELEATIKAVQGA